MTSDAGSTTLMSAVIPILPFETQQAVLYPPTISSISARLYIRIHSHAALSGPSTASIQTGFHMSAVRKRPWGTRWRSSEGLDLSWQCSCCSSSLHYLCAAHGLPLHCLWRWHDRHLHTKANNPLSPLL